MTQPSERLYIVLHRIESGVAMTHALHRKLLDKDVEYVYEAFQKFFKGEVAGRELPEPYSTSQAREQMIDVKYVDGRCTM
ncbi:MAG: hypothetical protein AAF741_17010 [Bacteroidota bacterium]